MSNASCYWCGGDLTTADRPNTGLCRMCEDLERADELRSPAWAGNACGPGGHVFVFSGGGSGGRVPDGLVCQCGRVMAKWVHCDSCGQDKMIDVPVYPGHPSFTMQGVCVAPNGGCGGCIAPEGCEGCEHLRPIPNKEPA